MREVLLTNDPVLLSFVQSLLEQDGITCIVFDQNISGIEGSIGVFPRRLMVTQDDWSTAARLMREVGLAAWVKQE